MQPKKPKFVPKQGLVARQKQLHTFPIDVDSESDGFHYIGTFTCKKMSISDLAALGVRKAQLNGGMHFDPTNPGRGVDSQTDNFSSMIAHLEVALVDYPKWWNLETVTDIDVLTAVYEEVFAFENSFLGLRRNEDADDGADGTGEDDSEGDLPKARARRVASKVVEQEVSDALEP